MASMSQRATFFHPSTAASRKASTRRISTTRILCSPSFGDFFYSFYSQVFTNDSERTVRLWAAFFHILSEYSLCHSMTIPSPGFEILVRPIVVDIATDRNLDNRSLKGSRTVFGDTIIDVVFEQLHVVFAHRRSKQLAKIGQCIKQIFRWANLVGIDDSIDPYFIDRIVCFRVMVIFQ